MALYKYDEIKKINFEAIPQEMKDVPQWFLWKAKDTGRTDGKLAKYPTDINGHAISWNDTDNLYTFDEIKKVYESSNNFEGISFNVAGSGLTIIDIDINVNTETGEKAELKPTEKPFLNAGYVEQSVSGRGYHVVLQGDLPSELSQEKNVYDKDGNKLEVFHNSGYIAMTGDVYNNHSQIDNKEISKKFINYLVQNYRTKSNTLNESHQEAHTGQSTNLDSFIPPKVNTIDVLALWFNTGSDKLKTKNVSKKDLWERADIAMQSYNNDRSEASYALVSELAYFMWDNPNGLYSMLINNRHWNEQDNYMKDNAKRLQHDIKKAINERKASGRLYQATASSNKTVPDITEAEQRQNKLLEHYNKSNAGAGLVDFINGIKENANTPPTSTGFPILDHVLNGGIREGLYVIGAISSLGKTTLVQHIGDNIAQNDTDVLFISLEMARTELMSKSISRETYLDTIEYGGNIRNAKVSLDITDGSKHDTFNNDEKKLIKTAIKRYSEYADNIYIVEAFGQIGHEDVRQLVELHKQHTERTPIVIIDYLQIMKPADPRQTDKTNTDVAVNSLKRLSRDYKTPVIAISSLNRESYNRPMSLSAFKESGAIEYSSDVLIGLDFTKMLDDPANMDFEEEKDKTPRNITLTILKNRNGRTGKRINYLYDPRFNHFEEDEYYTKQTNKEVKKAKRG
ncbi:DnaB-like helicase C-terminal domain-containing protein [Staphylococcus haemolyticus]|uniref:DnaB-like helicase C-terminal domain-containing protein n=4 Tax=Staphylococcus haemolyticus TaxID=1283 RepID=UPI00069E0DC2|nr:DnaB-like helicase C-terminal domain-containing protein [Staphylococcus haemolyticus]